MNIDKFLEQFVEGYLFSDLETMSQAHVAAGKSHGAVGYPMMTTLLTGMELLGGLLTPLNMSFDPDSGGATKFSYFWDNYLCKQYPSYSGLGKLIYALVRNGVAHTFVAKHGVIVHKFSGNGIKVDTEKNEIYVDPNVLYIQFRDTYYNKIKSIPDKSSMQNRLDRIEKAYSEKSKKYFDELGALDPNVLISNYHDKYKIKLPNMPTRSSGASGALGPINSPSTTFNTTTPFTTLSGTISPDDIPQIDTSQ